MGDYGGYRRRPGERWQESGVGLLEIIPWSKSRPPHDPEAFPSNAGEAMSLFLLLYRDSLSLSLSLSLSSLPRSKSRPMQESVYQDREKGKRLVTVRER